MSVTIDYLIVFNLVSLATSLSDMVIHFLSLEYHLLHLSALISNSKCSKMFDVSYLATNRTNNYTCISFVKHVSFTR